jgi:hypothetical protein
MKVTDSQKTKKTIPKTKTEVFGMLVFDSRAVRESLKRSRMTHTKPVTQ